jgi:hypothetical protein
VGLSTSKSDTQARKRSTTITSVEQAKNRYYLASPENVLGQETQLEHIAPYLTSGGEPINSLFDLVEGTGKPPSDLDLGSYQVRPAHFKSELTEGGNTTSSTNPYASLDDFLAAAGLNPDFTGTPDWGSVLNTTEGADALQEYLSELPPELYESIALTEGLHPDAARVLLDGMQEGTNADLAARELFLKSLDPSDPLYSQREQLDYSNYNWKWPPQVPYAGLDLSNTGITGANLMPEDYDPANPSIWDNWGGWNFTGANLSGIDMTGFIWDGMSGSTLSIPFQPVLGAGPILTGVNFTDAQNIDLNKLILATDSNGMILTGTGITKELYENALRNTFANLWESSNRIQIEERGEDPYWTEEKKQEFLDTQTVNITFDSP